MSNNKKITKQDIYQTTNICYNILRNSDIQLKTAEYKIFAYFLKNTTSLNLKL